LTEKIGVATAHHGILELRPHAGTGRRRVKVEGCELDIELLRPEITFAKAFTEAPFDVCEISFSNTVTAVSKGDFPYALIPVFLSRAFRHSSLFIRTDRGIACAEDLRSKTVGLQEYDMTAAVVVRGFLRDRHGVDPRDITWKVGERERTKPLEFPLGRPPGGVHIEILPPDRSLEDRLLAGELDAVIVLRPLDALRPATCAWRRCFPIRSLSRRHGSPPPGIFRSCMPSACARRFSRPMPGLDDGCSRRCCEEHRCC